MSKRHRGQRIHSKSKKHQVDYQGSPGVDLKKSNNIVEGTQMPGVTLMLKMWVQLGLGRK